MNSSVVFSQPVFGQGLSWVGGGLFLVRAGSAHYATVSRAVKWIEIVLLDCNT